MTIKIEEEVTLKFRVKCEYCHTTFTYEQGDLGFRPWYPKGFVYCPKCQKPLRHKPEEYLVKEGKATIEAEVVDK